MRVEKRSEWMKKPGAKMGTNEQKLLANLAGDKFIRGSRQQKRFHNRVSKIADVKSWEKHKMASSQTVYWNEKGSRSILEEEKARMVGTILLFIIRRLIILYIILAIILSGARNRSFSTSIFQVLLRGC